MMTIKFGPLMLFIILLLILVAASFYSNWSNKVDGFASGSNPFESLRNYDKFYKGLTQLTGNFYYDPKNGNVYRASVNSAKSITSVILYYRNEESNDIAKISYDPRVDAGAEVNKIISRASIVPYTGSVHIVFENDTPATQLNVTYWGTDTYISIFDIGNVSKTSGAGSYKITDLYYYEDSNLKKSVNFTTNNKITLVKKSSYKFSKDSYDNSYVIEPYYSSTQNLLQLMKNVKFDQVNGSLLVNFDDSAATTAAATTATATTAAATTPAATTSAATTTAATTPAATTATATTATATTAAATTSAATGASGSVTNGFRNIGSKGVLEYVRKIASAGINIDPSNTYTELGDKDTSDTFSSAYEPFFVQDSNSMNTILYWPSGKDTLVMVFANTCAQLSLGIESKLVNLISQEDKVVGKNTIDKGKTDDGSDKMLDDYLKWSNYMLKTEVVPPVCPACPSCNTGGICTDCGGKGGCGTKTDKGDSLAYKKTSDNSISDVKGPSSAVASVGKTAGDVVSGTVNTAGNVVSGTVNTAGDLVGGTIGTAANLVGGTIGTASDLLKSTGSGLSNLLSGDVRRVGYNQSYQGPGNGYNRNNTGIQGQSRLGMVDSVPIDIYSYGGALQSKGSDFRPLTADFSSFSK